MQYDNYKSSFLMGGEKQPLIQYFWLAVPPKILIWTLFVMLLEQKLHLFLHCSKNPKVPLKPEY